MSHHADPVPCYGIHFNAAENSEVLIQGRLGRQGHGNWHPGGKRVQRALRVELPGGRQHCNTQICMSAQAPHDSHSDRFAAWVKEDRLLQVCLPLPEPGPGVFVLPYESHRTERVLSLFATLARLSSPIDAVVHTAEEARGEWQDLAEKISDVNIQTRFIVGCREQDQEWLEPFCDRVSRGPGKVVIAGSEALTTLGGAAPISTGLLDDTVDHLILQQMHWEALGAMVIRFSTRGEWDPARAREVFAMRREERARSESVGRIGDNARRRPTHHHAARHGGRDAQTRNAGQRPHQTTGTGR